MAVEKIADETGVKFLLSADRHQIVNAIRVSIETFETNADSVESILQLRSDYSAARILAKLRLDGFTYPEFDSEPAPTVEDALNRWIDEQETIHLGIERAGWVPCGGIEIRQDDAGWAVSVRRWPDVPAICLTGMNALIRRLEIELEKLALETRQETTELPTAEEKTPKGDELLTDMPPIPGQNGATWDDTFDWYCRVPRCKCPDLQILASLIGMDYGTVRNRHSEYKAEYGEQPRPTSR